MQLSTHNSSSAASIASEVDDKILLASTEELVDREKYGEEWEVKEVGKGQGR